MSAPTNREFAGTSFDFAPGEIYGLRGWTMDEYGRLRAMHLPGVAPWRPGLNTAACYKADDATVASVARFILGPTAYVENPEHPAPHEGCHCGFYAYTSLGPASYAIGTGFVFGIIRGSGRTLIGTKGFRCEKAEIVAFLDPTANVDAERDVLVRWRLDRLRAVYPDIPLLGSRDELIRFAPIESTAPPPSSDEFWGLP